MIEYHKSMIQQLNRHPQVFYAAIAILGFLILDHYYGFAILWNFTFLIGTFADRYIGARTILLLIFIVAGFYAFIFHWWLPREDEKVLRNSFVQRVDREQFELHQKRVTLDAMRNLHNHPRYPEVVEEGTTTRRDSVASGRASHVNSRTGTGHLE